MKAKWLIFTALGFVLFHEGSAAQAQTKRYPGSDLGIPIVAQLSRAQAAHRSNFTAAPARVMEASASGRLPAFYQEDTPFSSQMRLSVAHLLGGRLRFDAFYREISINNMVRGGAQSNDFWQPMTGGQSGSPEKSYGFTLSFAFSGSGAKER